ncbi:MAG: hypothetical protein LBH20_01270 [Treponema sp.]|jgi:hypothetical protein|nr:hypothetical protein [Treponema sp.]
MKYKQFWKICVLCLVSAFANVVVSHLFSGVPLYLDTVFNAAIVFSAGLFAALVTGILLFPIAAFFVLRYYDGLPLEISLLNVWLICVAVEILIIWFFYKRMKKQEAVFLEKPSLNSFTGVGAFLLVLAMIDCVAVSITGGIIDFVLIVRQTPRTFSPEDSFKLGLLQNNVPLMATTILSRIPINIADRIIVVFGGYGISLWFRKWLVNKSAAE